MMRNINNWTNDFTEVYWWVHKRSILSAVNSDISKRRGEVRKIIIWSVTNKSCNRKIFLPTSSYITPNRATSYQTQRFSINFKIRQNFIYYLLRKKAIIFFFFLKRHVYITSTSFFITNTSRIYIRNFFKTFFYFFIFFIAIKSRNFAQKGTTVVIVISNSYLLYNFFFLVKKLRGPCCDLERQ